MCSAAINAVIDLIRIILRAFRTLMRVRFWYNKKLWEKEQRVYFLNIKIGHWACCKSCGGYRYLRDEYEYVWSDIFNDWRYEPTECRDCSKIPVFIIIEPLELCNWLINVIRYHYYWKFLDYITDYIEKRELHPRMAVYNIKTGTFYENTIHFFPDKVYNDLEQIRLESFRKDPDTYHDFIVKEYDQAPLPNYFLH
jgi:hypothetical protein